MTTFPELLGQAMPHQPVVRRLERLAEAHILRDSILYTRRAILVGNASPQLFIGPLVAEFGHELMYAAVVRKAAKGFDSVVVCSRPGRKALYNDFATEFIAHDIECESQFMWPMPDPTITRDVIARWSRPQAVCLAILPYCPGQAAEFRRYGTRKKEFEDVTVLHARSRPHVLARNWPLEWWETLVADMRNEGIVDRVVCIGTPSHALHVAGTDDCRGATLSEQMDILASAKFAVGPSSGPMHLASHCGCPHVVWCGGGPQERVETARRYRSAWNPFGTRVVAVPYASWRPEPPTVLIWIHKLLEKTGGDPPGVAG